MVDVRSLRIIHLTIYSVLIGTFIVAARRPYYGAYGLICTSPCEANSRGAFCWSTRKDLSPWEGKASRGKTWDYCSPVKGKDYNGRRCIPNKCYTRGRGPEGWSGKKDFNFCYIEKSTFWTFFRSRNWGYCSDSDVKG